MKRQIIALTAIALFLAACGQLEVSNHQADSVAGDQAERSAVEARILNYFHGQGLADRTRLESAFAEEVATMISPAEEGAAFQRREITAMIEQWSDNPNPPGERTDFQILSIEIVDGRLATVTFRFTDRFYDAFLLIKQDGEWQIVSKAFVEQ